MSTSEPKAQRKLSPEQGQTRLSFYEGLFKIVLGVTTFGASITFSLILNELRAPNYYFSPSTVQIFLASSWLCFILALSAACIMTSFLNFYGDQIREQWGSAREQRKWLWIGAASSFILGGLIFGAFVFLSLSVMAYVKIVGFIAMGITGCIALFAAVVGYINSPLLVSYKGHEGAGSSER
jgi:hypothetical protein